MEDILLGAVALDEERYRLVPIRAGQPIIIRALALVFRLNGGTIRVVLNDNVDTAFLDVDVYPIRCWRNRKLWEMERDM